MEILIFVSFALLCGFLGYLFREELINFVNGLKCEDSAPKIIKNHISRGKELAVANQLIDSQKEYIANLEAQNKNLKKNLEDVKYELAREKRRDIRPKFIKLVRLQSDPMFTAAKKGELMPKYIEQFQATYKRMDY